ncbi:MAG TPA: DinB family protein [Candidatus Angelobacter sp.]|nr:DinB family protein [Candidatus Angelobacter sp.]
MNAIANPLMHPEGDKEVLLTLLSASRERFLSSFVDVTEQQAHVRPERDRWSVIETVEHLTMAEATMLKLLSRPRRPRPATAPNREEVFLSPGADRSRRLESPDGARPRGRFATLAEARAQFSSVRAGAIEFVRENSEDLRAFEVTHPHPAAGNVSLYELFVLIARHAERHAMQIEETKGIKAVRGAETS